MTVAYYETRDAKPLACDECGGIVDSSERGRALHAAWHEERREIVVDLTAVKQLVA